MCFQSSAPCANVIVRAKNAVYLTSEQAEKEYKNLKARTEINSEEIQHGASGTRETDGAL